MAVATCLCRTPKTGFSSGTAIARELAQRLKERAASA
jgi:hypothetical protein